MKNTEQILNNFIDTLNHNEFLFESSSISKNEIKTAEVKAKNTVKKDISNPDDVEEFLNKNELKYKETLNKLETEKQKSTLKKAWQYTWYAIKQGTAFVLKHWDKILKLLFILTLAFFSYKVYAFFAGIFGGISDFFNGCIKAGAEIDAANRAAGGYGGWTGAGLGGGLRGY